MLSLSYRRAPKRGSAAEKALNSLTKKQKGILILACVIGFFGFLGFLIYLWARIHEVTAVP